MTDQQYPKRQPGKQLPPAAGPWNNPQSPYGANELPRSRNTAEPAFVRVPARRRSSPGCCLAYLFVSAGFGLLSLSVYLLFPARTNILILGIDYTPSYSAVGRSDTMILSTFLPHKGYVGMLSIPRDLWVSIPGYGENRINTAHFFAEASTTGSGPEKAMETVRQNFGVAVNRYVRLRFDGVREIVNAMGGVDIELDRPMANYPAGKHHLTGNKALAFARNRQGSDDFFRMEQGQLLIKAMFKQMLNPMKWVRLPWVLAALTQSVDTNVPVWIWPRLGFTLLRTGPDGIDHRTIRREMVTPFSTSEGAAVLAPNWDQINPVLLEIFEQ